MSFHIVRIKCSFIWCIDMMVWKHWCWDVFEGMGISQDIICHLWGNCPLVINRHGCISLWWANKERGYWNVKSFNWRIFLNVSREKGLNLHRSYNDTKGLNTFMKKMPKPFKESHYKRDGTQQKKKSWTKNEQLSFTKWTPFLTLCNTSCL